MIRRSATLALFALFGCAGPAPKATPPRPAPATATATASREPERIPVAITVDDLPLQEESASLDEGMRTTQGILEALRAHHAPSTGFVVCKRAEGREPLLRAWLAAGMDLGNHSMHHDGIEAMSKETWQADVADCNARLTAITGKPTRYFRYPYLQMGETVARREAGLASLRANGLTHAPVSLDTSDWVVRKAYDDARDDAGRAQSGDAYVAHVVAAFRHYQEVSKAKLGRQAAQIVLLHAHHLAGARLGDLLGALEGEGARFVSLEEALRDPLYEMPDHYAGPIGDSWLYRITEGGDKAWVWDLGQERALGDRFQVKDEGLSSEKALRIDVDLAARELARGVLVIVDQAPFPANSLVVEAADGTLVLVGTPYTTEATERLLVWLEARFGKRKRIAINPHFHWDALGGNAALERAGIPVYASTHTRDLLRARGPAMREGMLRMVEKEPERAAGFRELPAPPDHLFEESAGLTLTLGKDTVRVIYPGAGHAPDNVVVLFVERRLLFGGCLVRAMPGLGNTGDADLASWPAAIKKVQALDATVVVPGHGEQFAPSILDQTLKALEAGAP